MPALRSNPFHHSAPGPLGPSTLLHRIDVQFTRCGGTFPPQPNLRPLRNSRFPFRGFAAYCGHLHYFAASLFLQQFPS